MKGFSFTNLFLLMFSAFMLVFSNDSIASIIEQDEYELVCSNLTYREQLECISKTKDTLKLESVRDLFSAYEFVHQNDQFEDICFRIDLKCGQNKHFVICSSDEAESDLNCFDDSKKAENLFFLVKRIARLSEVDDEDFSSSSIFDLSRLIEQISDNQTENELIFQDSETEDLDFDPYLLNHLKFVDSALRRPSFVSAGSASGASSSSSYKEDRFKDHLKIEPEIESFKEFELEVSDSDNEEMLFYEEKSIDLSRFEDFRGLIDPLIEILIKEALSYQGQTADRLLFEIEDSNAFKEIDSFLNVSFQELFSLLSQSVFLTSLDLERIFSNRLDEKFDSKTDLEDSDFFQYLTLLTEDEEFSQILFSKALSENEKCLFSPNQCREQPIPEPDSVLLFLLFGLNLYIGSRLIKFLTEISS